MSEDDDLILDDQPAAAPAVDAFELLSAYERRSLAHVAGLPEQLQAAGLWRGIGFRIGTHYLVSGIGEVNEILTMPAMTVIPGTKPWMLGVAMIVMGFFGNATNNRSASR